jgi:hypothetical protein
VRPVRCRRHGRWSAERGGLKMAVLLALFELLKAYLEQCLKFREGGGCLSVLSSWEDRALASSGYWLLLRVQAFPSGNSMRSFAYSPPVAGKKIPRNSAGPPTGVKSIVMVCLPATLPTSAFSAVGA